MGRFHHWSVPQGRGERGEGALRPVLEHLALRAPLPGDQPARGVARADVGVVDTPAEARGRRGEAVQHAELRMGVGVEEEHRALDGDREVLAVRRVVHLPRGEVELAPWEERADADVVGAQLLLS